MPEVSSHDIQVRCSDACTRSGALALIFSVVAFSMIGSAESAINLNALGRYISLRDSLNDALVRLSQDPCWQALQESINGKAAEHEWSIAKLSQHNCSTRNPNESFEAGKALRNSADKRPAPPTVVIPITSIVEITEAVRSLGNTRLIKRAKETRYDFAWSIYRWEMLRLKLYATNLKRPIDADPVIGEPPEMWLYMEGMPLNPDGWGRHLTLDNIRELAEFERSDSVRVLDYFEKKRDFQVPAINQSLPIKTAMLAVQWMLVMTVLYFWLYRAEARKTQSYPLAGTLFAVFGRTKSTRAIYLALIGTPLIASVALAVSSFEVTGWGTVPTIGIAILTLCIFADNFRP